ncbi:MAG: glutamine cyclotransferase [Acidobacteriota bacterium]
MLLVAVAVTTGAEASAGTAPPAPAVGVPRVVAVRPHDARAYVQGLLFHDGRLYESNGQYGRSQLVEIDPTNGRVLRSVRLPSDEFAEGLARVGDRLIQLTWREGVARIWRLPGLEPAGEWRYEGEGWGLTFDGERLIQSDGSAVLTFRSPEDFRILGRVTVRRGGSAVPYLNELEWVEGAIYANVWMSDEILRIDPASGEVTAAWDASGLLDPAARELGAEVLNGIAWDPGRRVFHVTGKYWPSRFEVELAPPPAR